MADSNGDGLELTKGDTSIKVRGREAVVALLVVVIVVGGGWLVIREIQAHNVQAMEKYQLVQESNAILTQKVDQGHKELQESIEASLYLMSLPDAERAKIRLRKPLKIRQMEGRD